VSLAYATYGTLAPDGGNCIVLPTYYTGTHESYLPWIGASGVFDTDQWYVVVPNLIANGLSTIHHAGTGAVWDPRSDPVVSIRDNVALQRVLMARLGVRRIALVAGWSMGGLQAYEWAVSYGDLVDAILPICAASRCWPLNHIFLEGLVPYLEQALDHPEVAPASLRNFGRAYAGWAYSASYFRDETWRADGYSSMEELCRLWGEDHLTWSASDLLIMLRTWQSAGPSGHQSWHEALESVTARAIVMPSVTDMYFTEAENELEARCLRSGELRRISSVHGHIAGRPGHLPEVTDQVATAVRQLLTIP
jgi:homoserine O-acetyltransferase